MSFYDKYMKYKKKYLELVGGSDNSELIYGIKLKVYDDEIIHRTANATFSFSMNNTKDHHFGRYAGFFTTINVTNEHPLHVAVHKQYDDFNRELCKELNETKIVTYKLKSFNTSIFTNEELSLFVSVFSVCEEMNNQYKYRKAVEHFNKTFRPLSYKDKAQEDERKRTQENMIRDEFKIYITHSTGTTKHELISEEIIKDIINSDYYRFDKTNPRPNIEKKFIINEAKEVLRKLKGLIFNIESESDDYIDKYISDDKIEKEEILKRIEQYKYKELGAHIQTIVKKYISKINDPEETINPVRTVYYYIKWGATGITKNELINNIVDVEDGILNEVKNINLDKEPENGMRYINYNNHARGIYDLIRCALTPFIAYKYEIEFVTEKPT